MSCDDDRMRKIWACLHRFRAELGTVPLDWCKRAARLLKLTYRQVDECWEGLRHRGLVRRNPTASGAARVELLAAFDADFASHPDRRAGRGADAEPQQRADAVRAPAGAGVRTRHCLKCSRAFRSEGPGHRVCPACKLSESWRSGAWMNGCPDC